MKQRETPLPISQKQQKDNVKRILTGCIYSQTKGGEVEKRENADAIARMLLDDAIAGVVSYSGIGSKLIGRNRSYDAIYTPSNGYRIIRIRHDKRGGIVCIPAELAWNHPKLDAPTLPEALELAGELIRAWPTLPCGKEILHFSIQKRQTQPIQKQ